MKQHPPATGLPSSETTTLDLSGMCVGNSYILIQPIGAGATGTVWRAVDRATGEQVAVKLLHERLLRQPKLVSRFVQERTILLMLRHENIVRVRDLFSAGESLGLVMDLVAGGSLRDLLCERRTLPPAEAARLLAQVAAALSEAHDMSVVHRDLKPDNILLDRSEGRLDARLTDFGVARILDASGLTTAGALVGTPHYMAPETISGAPPAPAADVYAMGVMLYELIAGQPPYRGVTPILLHRHVAEDPERRPGMPDIVWSVIRSCMDKDPQRRPTAAALVTTLRSLAQATDSLPALPGPVRRSMVDDSQVTAHVPRPSHPAAPAPGGPPVPRQRQLPPRPNRPPTRRWIRPGAMAVLVVGALIASGISGISAWQLRGTGRSAAPSAPLTAPGTPAGPGATKAGGSADPSSSAATPLPSLLGGSAAGGEPTDGTVVGGGASVGPGQIDARANLPDPWHCGDSYRWDVGHLALAKQCYAVGASIRVVGHMQALPGVQADVSISVEDATTGQTAAGPYTCKGLMFTDFSPEHTCGPFELNAPHGRRYVVVQQWQYTGRGLLPGGTARGPEFSW